MELGVNLINFGPAAEPAAFARWARAAEDLGYGFLTVSDHVALTPDVAARFPPPFYDPLVLLGWLAGVTSRVRLGASVVILPYRHPLLIARSLANVDRLSGGRALLGVGVGWSKPEYDALGVPFERRGAIADEWLAVIRDAFAAETVSHDGRFARFADVATGPAPVRSGGPPIWVGGGSAAAMRRAVRFGDAWHPYRFTVARLRDAALPALRALAEEESRPLPAVCPRITLRLTAHDLADDERVAGEGSPDQLRRDLAALEELGCPQVLLDTYTEDMAAAGDADASLRLFETVAADVFDLARGTVR